MNLDATDATIQATAEAMQLASLLDSRFGHSDDARVKAWAEQVQRHRIDRGDLLDAVQAFYDTRQPYPLGIGDLLDAARAIRRDRVQREPIQERIDGQTPAERETAEDVRAISEAFFATSGPVANPTERLEAAKRGLQHCYGKAESIAAIREFLAAKAEARGNTRKQAIDPDKVRLAQTVRCQWCHAQPGQGCTSGTNRTPAGGFHPTRLDDARKASTR